MANIPFLYTVNDDLFIKNILSGAYLGSPDAHVVYMEYPLGFLIQSLYQWQRGIPWYGICLLLLQFLAWGSVFYRFIKTEKTPKSRIVKAVLIGAVFMTVGFYHMASMQYTVTAAVLGMAALVWFYTCDFDATTKRVLVDQLMTALLVLLSYNVRKNVLLMLLPFAGMIWLRKWLSHPSNFRKKIETFGGIILIVGASIALTYSVSYDAYASAGWQYYKTYNDNATILYDYYGWPEYEENLELYEELGISYEAYYGAKHHYLLSVDSAIDANAMERLATRSKEIYEDHNSIRAQINTALQNTALRMVQDTDRPFNFVILSLYVMIIGLAVWQKKGAVFTSVAFLWIGRMFVWIYIVYQGRYPTRITQSLFFAECGILLAILFTELWDHKWNRKGMLLIGSCYLVLLVGLSAARIKHVTIENNARMEASRGLQVLKQYCGERLENFYMVDSKSITQDTESILDKNGGRFENYIVFGGWLSGSPIYNKKLENAGITSVEESLLEQENVFVIFRKKDEYKKEYLFQYFRSKYPNFSEQVVDCFGESENQFLVYKFID